MTCVQGIQTYIEITILTEEFLKHVIIIILFFDIFTWAYT